MKANPTKRPKLPYGQLVGQYKIIKCVGQGGYGDIYYISSPSSDFPLAMKFEQTTARKQALKKEYEFMEMLQGSIHFPKVVQFVEQAEYRYMVMEMLGPSISNVRKLCHRRQFSMSTTIQVAKMMLKVIKELHENGIIHRDIKPSNFLIRPSSDDFLCLIDFGLSKTYVNQKTGKLYEELEHPGFKGTLKYASPYTHVGDDQGRRDDLFSWFYSICELKLGKLPWNDIKGRTHVLKAKKHFKRSAEILLLPSSFPTILRYIETLKFYQEPDYQFIESLLDDLFEKYDCSPNDPLDWENISNERAIKISVFPLMRTDKLRPFPLEVLLKTDSENYSRPTRPTTNYDIQRTTTRTTQFNSQNITQNEIQGKNETRQQNDAKRKGPSSSVCLLL